VAFDHVTAEIVADNDSDIVVRLVNPTPMIASVRVFSETVSEAMIALPENHLLDCPVVVIKPGEVTDVTFLKSGSALNPGSLSKK
jgi:hypothetical protein